MKIKWLGHSSFLIISDKGTKIITDPYQSGGFGGQLKYGKINEAADIVTVSHDHADHNNVAGIPGKPEIVKGPGTKEAEGITFKGISAYHDTTKGSERGTDTIFCFSVDGVNICHLGDLGHILSDQQIKEMGQVDVLLVPVGGYFTIDAATASRVVEQVKPRVVIPMHVKNERCDFKIATVDDFIRGRADVQKMDGSEVELSKDKLPASTQIIVLEPAL